MKFDTATVRLIMAIVEHGSISRAADRLDLAVAAASRRVSDLEAQLGTRLFQRLPHGVVITESGARLLEHLRQIDNLVVRLEGDAKALHEGLSGRILIGAPKAVVIPFLAQDMARVRRRFPGVALRVIEENSQIVQQMLRDKVVDIGIYEHRSGYLDMEKLPYRNDRLVLVYSKAHYRFDGAPLGLDALLELPVVSLGRGSAILTAVQRAYLSRGKPFSNDFEVSGFDSMLALVRNGLGVGLMPPDVLASFRPESGLGSVELDGDWHHRRFVLSRVAGHAQAQTLENVVQELIGPAAH